MLSKIFISILLLTSLLPSPAFSSDKDLSDDEVRQIMIQESIDKYPGNCPCPYNLASNGSQCGKRSAYSRLGGYTPLCYPSDISDEMVEEYRREHHLPK